MEGLQYNFYTQELDDRFRYDGKDLGVYCSEEGSIFKVWSPFSEKVELRLYADEETDVCEKHEMLPDGRGVWKYSAGRELNGTYYDYLVWQNGEAVRTADPYAVACSCNGRRSLVLDLGQTDPEGFSQDVPPEKEPETVIYELHVKDFSHDPASEVPEEYRGKFKAFTFRKPDGSLPVCMRHLKELGVTHVHLLPIFDYGALDEAGSEEQYNWGYDPVNYNVPEGSYSTDPRDGAARIRECKEMVQALHQNGLRVVMDVVYNHTFQPNSWLERMAPGYYNRRFADGSLSDGSACGSDLAAGRAMVDNYIVDSVLFWAREYHIDGFRFDLMGLLTVELMNRIRRELDREFGPGEKLLYGEPWRAADSPMEPGTHAALKDNIALLDNSIAVFSDDTRDAVKGHVFYEEVAGFVNGGSGLERSILGAVSGWRKNREGFVPRSCSQIVNYVSAHDNLALWDKLVLSMHGGSGKNNEYREESGKASEPAAFTQRYEDVLRANRLAAMIYFTCQGHLFFQAGEEFGRTKLGDHNSFRSAPEVNRLDWERCREYVDLVDYYKGLIRLRKGLTGLCDKSPEAADRIFEEKVCCERAVSFRVDNSGGQGEWQQLFIAFNAGERDVTVPLPGSDCAAAAADNANIGGCQAAEAESGACHAAAEAGNGTCHAAAEAGKSACHAAPEADEWFILADGDEADCRKAAVLTEEGCIRVKAVSGVVLGCRKPVRGSGAEN